MPWVLRYATVGVVCGVALWVQPALHADDHAPASAPSQTAHPGANRSNHSKRKVLNQGERSSVISVALHSQKARSGGRDCSHLVHAIYERAGFPYVYADSEDLYAGVEGFERVARPQTADLVVWHGHVGIVIRPSRHEFFSFLSVGPGIDDYTSRYWKGRGQPRFYRYIKGVDCPGCTVAHANGE